MDRVFCVTNGVEYLGGRWHLETEGADLFLDFEGEAGAMPVFTDDDLVAFRNLVEAALWQALGEVFDTGDYEGDDWDAFVEVNRFPLTVDDIRVKLGITYHLTQEEALRLQNSRHGS